MLLKRTFIACLMGLFLKPPAGAAQFEAPYGFIVEGLSLFSSSVTVTGKDPVSGYGLALSSGVYTPVGTIYANLFIGDGSGLFNILTGDDLGDHSAGRDIEFNGFNIVNVSSLAFTPVIGLSSAPAKNYGGVFISTHAHLNGDMRAVKYYGNGSALANLPAPPDDDMGNHTAAQAIDADSFDLLNVSSITFSSQVGLSSATKANYGGVYSSTHVYANDNVYAGRFYGDAEGMTNISASGADDDLGNHTAAQVLDMVAGSVINVDTATITGNAFSVDGSTLNVKDGNVGIGAASPQAALEFGAAAIFSSEYNNGNSGTAKTISWANGNMQAVTLTGNVTFTFSAVSAGRAANLILRVAQDATGGRSVIWPAAVKWLGGTAAALSTNANVVDIVTFYFDGANYYGGFTTGYQ